MMLKFVAIVSCLAAASAATTPYSSAPSVSSVYSSTPKAPAPIYEANTEVRENAQDGSQKTTYSKSIISPLSTVQHYDTQITNNGALLHTYPTIYSSPIHTFYNPTTSYHSVATPLITKTYSTPIYTHTNTVPVLTKTYSTPILTKSAASGLTTYTHGPIVQDQHLKTTITYSAAPLVSHMTFSGLGANYAW